MILKTTLPNGEVRNATLAEVEAHIAQIGAQRARELGIVPAPPVVPDPPRGARRKRTSGK